MAGHCANLIHAMYTHHDGACRDAALDPQPKQPQQQQPGEAGKGAGGAGKGAGDAYETIRIPASPDPSSLPPELQAFREQCAAGRWGEGEGVQDLVGGG